MLENDVTILNNQSHTNFDINTRRVTSRSVVMRLLLFKQQLINKSILSR